MLNRGVWWVRYCLVAVVLVSSMMGCASNLPKYSEISPEFPRIPAGKGRVFFYRDSWMGAALSPNIRVNGMVVGESVNGQVFFHDWAPGDYTVSLTTEATNEVQLHLHARERLYVRVYISMGFFVGHPHPELVDAAKAQNDIEGLRFVSTRSSGALGRKVAGQGT